MNANEIVGSNGLILGAAAVIGTLVYLAIKRLQKRYLTWLVDPNLEDDLDHLRNTIHTPGAVIAWLEENEESSPGAGENW